MQSSRTLTLLAGKLLCFLIFALISLDAAGSTSYPLEGNGTASHHNTSGLLLQTRRTDPGEGKNDSTTQESKHIRRRRWSLSGSGGSFGQSSRSSRDLITNTGSLDESLDANNKLEMGTKIKNFYRIFESLSSQDELQSPKILSLSLEVYETYIYAWTHFLKDSSAAILRLHNEIKPHLQSFLEKWADLLLKDDYGDILTYSRSSLRAGNSVKHFFPQIIVKAYEKGKKVASVPQLLKGVSDLPWLSQHASGFMAILQEMKKNGEIDNHYQITMLAHEVHGTMKINNLAHVVSETAHVFDAIKMELPDGVQRLLWNPWINLESVEHGGYTLANRGGISLYPDTNFPGGTCQKWKVKSVDRGHYFEFQNSYTNNFLSTGDHKSAHQKHWQVFPVDRSTSFRIQNRHFQQCVDVGEEKSSCEDSRLDRCYSTLIATWDNQKVSQKWKIL